MRQIRPIQRKMLNCEGFLRSVLKKLHDRPARGIQNLCQIPQSSCAPDELPGPKKNNQCAQRRNLMKVLVHLSRLGAPSVDAHKSQNQRPQQLSPQIVIAPIQVTATAAQTATTMAITPVAIMRSIRILGFADLLGFQDNGVRRLQRLERLATTAATAETTTTKTHILIQPHTQPGRAALGMLTTTTGTLR